MSPPGTGRTRGAVADQASVPQNAQAVVVCEATGMAEALKARSHGEGACCGNDGDVQGPWVSASLWWWGDRHGGWTRSTAGLGGDRLPSVVGRNMSGAYVTGDDNVSGYLASEPYCRRRLNSCQVMNSCSGRMVVETCGEGWLGGCCTISIDATTLDTGKLRTRPRAIIPSRTSNGNRAKRCSVQS
jgi:hypothetical protein